MKGEIIGRVFIFYFEYVYLFKKIFFNNIFVLFYNIKVFIENDFEVTGWD